MGLELSSGALGAFQEDITSLGIFCLQEHLASRIIGLSQRDAGLIYGGNWRGS